MCSTVCALPFAVDNKILALQTQYSELNMSTRKNVPHFYDEYDATSLFRPTVNITSPFRAAAAVKEI